MLATIYALFCIVIVPIMLVAVLVGGRGAAGGVPLAMVVVMPLLYIVIGFIGGIVGAFIYNIVAGWIGGIEIEYE
jgi:hypothetical protein